MRNLLVSGKLAANNLDLIRFLRAVAVMYSHWYVICYGKLVDTEPFMILTRNQMDLGGLAYSWLSGLLCISVGYRLIRLLHEWYHYWKVVPLVLPVSTRWISLRRSAPGSRMT